MAALIPAILAALFLLAPIAVVVPLSFSTAPSLEFPPRGYWLGHYGAYFASPDWLAATANSFIVAFGTMALTLVLVVPTAFGIIRYRFAGKSLVNLLLLLPLIVPQIVAALGYYGFLARVQLVGTHAGLVIAHTALSIPVAFLVVCAALKRVDRNLERAAMMSGAGPLQAFVWVTFPLMRPGILVGGLFAFLTSFVEAVVAIFIGGRDASTLPKKMFESIRLESDPIIAVVSTLLIAVILLGVLIAVSLRRRFLRKRGLEASRRTGTF